MVEITGGDIGRSSLTHGSLAIGSRSGQGLFMTAGIVCNGGLLVVGRASAWFVSRVAVEQPRLWLAAAMAVRHQTTGPAVSPVRRRVRCLGTVVARRREPLSRRDF
jgi:hypothetical protein